MGASLSIRTMLAEMPQGQIFTSRDFIGAGSRDAVDKCLSRLAESGIIQRVSRGVFTNGKPEVPVDLVDVARAKAAAFGKEIFEHPVTTAQRLGYVKRPGKNDDLVVATDGSSSSSFRVGDRVVHLKAVSPRKRREEKNEVWEMLKALWHIGKGKLDGKVQRHIMNVWTAKMQNLVAQYTACVPHWLLDQFPRNSQATYQALYLKNVPCAYEKLCEQEERELQRLQRLQQLQQRPSQLKPAQQPEQTAESVENTATNAELQKWHEELMEEVAKDSKHYCSCPEADDECICPMFMCSYCQERPLNNRFRVA